MHRELAALLKEVLAIDRVSTWPDAPTDWPTRLREACTELRAQDLAIEVKLLDAHAAPQDFRLQLFDAIYNARRVLRHAGLDRRVVLLAVQASRAEAPLKNLEATLDETSTPQPRHAATVPGGPCIDVHAMAVGVAPRDLFLLLTGAEWTTSTCIRTTWLQQLPPPEAGSLAYLRTHPEPRNELWRQCMVKETVRHHLRRGEVNGVDIVSLTEELAPFGVSAEAISQAIAASESLHWSQPPVGARAVATMRGTD